MCMQYPVSLLRQSVSRDLSKSFLGSVLAAYGVPSHCLRTRNRNFCTITLLRMPNNAAINANKRKAAAASATEPTSKKLKEDIPEVEKYGIVDGRYYPPEMANTRCQQYNDGILPRPIKLLDTALDETKTERESMPVKEAVVHWFKWDLRIQDNKALHLASEKARSKGVPLLCVFIVSPQDYEAHMTSPVRVDFMLRTLEVLKEDLAKLDIPLYVETVEKRQAMPKRIFELCEKWGAKHLFANVEYEVDELRREARMVRKGLEKGIAFTVVPDTCVVAPGELSSQQGKQYAVYSPWFRAWIAYLHSHPKHLDLYPLPSVNPPSAHTQYKDLFDCTIPTAPENKKLIDEERKRF